MEMLIQLEIRIIFVPVSVIVILCLASDKGDKTKTKQLSKNVENQVIKYRISKMFGGKIFLANIKVWAQFFKHVLFHSFRLSPL